MSHIIEKLYEKNLINPPQYVLKETQYLTMVGSIAYGCANTNDRDQISDIDIYGFCIPDKDIIFPHLRGEILGFGKQNKRFDQYQQHHIKDTQKEYDVTIYNIVKYFQLCMENNPNMIDSLFTPQRCVLFCSEIGNLVRENRKLFLHKGSFYKLKGYAFSQLYKMKNRSILELANLIREVDFSVEEILNWSNYSSNLIIKDRDKNRMGKIHELMQRLSRDYNLSKRLPSIVEYGYDLKFAYHIVRLLNQSEQILIEHDLDLEKNREQLKSIRRGEWTIRQIEDYFDKKEKDLESLYIKSDLEYSPNEEAIKQLLLNCLEMHFGSLYSVVENPKGIDILLSEFQDIINRVGNIS
jgi:hypothetical protein